MRVSLNWLKDFVDVKDDASKMQDILTMAGLEVTSTVPIEGDNVMDIEVTPNRPDCLSILGIAREFSASANKQLKIPSSIEKFYMKKGSTRGSVQINVLDRKDCPRYVGSIMKNVKVGASPAWMVARLNAIGLRSINNIVDITNYVLLETGEPLHAFDVDKLEGKRIVVRKAKKGETIVTIDGVRRELDSTVLVIADANKPVAIAGIMGGKETEISEGTKNILIESAYFEPINIRRAQHKLGLATESSYRFERGVDIAMILSANIRAQELVKDLADGRIKGQVTDIGGSPVKEREIVLFLDEIPRVLGIDIEDKKCVDFLKRLHLKVTRKQKNKIVINVPPYRQDLERDIDLVEEIARLYGYNNIPSKIPTWTLGKTYEEEKKEISSFVKEAKRILYSLGINEIVTYTLTNRSSIETMGHHFDNVLQLKNPLSSNQEFMRPGLISEMLEVISWNLNRKNTFLQLFELDKVYSAKKGTDEVQERLNLCIGICGATNGSWKDKPRKIDFFDLKGIVEALLTSLGIKGYTIEKKDIFVFNKMTISTHILIDGKTVGKLGELDPDIARNFDIKQKAYIAEMDMEDLLPYLDIKKRFASIPRYPSVRRDIAILIEDPINSSSVVDVIKKEAKDIVRAIDVFDLYKGQQIEQGKKSLGYTLEYRSDERTLKDEEVSLIHKNVQDALVKKLGAEIR